MSRTARHHCLTVWLGVPLLCLLFLSAASVEAQELETREGKVHRGHAFPGAQEYRLNVHGSTASEMTFGVITFRTRDVREVRDEATPAGFFRQLMALPARDLPARVALLRWAQTRRLRREIPRAAAEVLLLDKTNEEALSALKGQRKWDALRAGHLHLDTELISGLRRLIRLESGAERRAAAKRLSLAGGAALPAHLVERMARSLTMDRGLSTKVPLTLRGSEFPGATYELFVPDEYDPLEPRPLLIALHGGGIMNSEGEVVIGSGRDATAIFLAGARRNGWIVAAPTAVEAPWGTDRNEKLIEAVLEEVTALWNVDLERVHLAGHGGGGDGVWWYAARHADEFASIGVAAAGEPKAYASIAKKTAIWIYHGDEDEIVPVAPVRKAALRLLKAKADAVYCELPGEKHGFPPAADRDWYAFGNPRRRLKAKQPWPRASFLRPPTADEIAAFGDPGGGWGETLAPDLTPRDLIEVIRAGQLDAEPAARRLAVEGGQDPGLRVALRSIVKERDASIPSRTWAAWVLGQWRDPDALGVLGDVLRSAKDAGLLRRAAEAVGRLANADSQEDLRWALTDLRARYKALKGKTIPFVEYERACRLGAELAMAMGRVGVAAEVQGDIEEALVIGILRDRRPVVHRRENGEDPTAWKSHLAEGLGRAYKAMQVDKTVAQMLLAVLRRDPAPRQAAARGLRQGLPPLK